MSYTGFWDEIRKIPPVTRFLCGSSLAVSIPVMMQLMSPYKLIFVPVLVTQKFEVSSCATAWDETVVLMNCSCGGSGLPSFSEVRGFVLSHQMDADAHGHYRHWTQLCI